MVMAILPQKPRIRLFIKEWMEAIGMTQTEVAKAAGISAAYLSEIIGPKQKMPTIPTLRDIADALGLPMQRLFEPPPSRETVRSMADIDPVTLARLLSNRRMN